MRTNLIPSDRALPLAEAIVDHSLRWSLETRKLQKHSKWTHPIIATRGDNDTITVILHLVANMFTCLFPVSQTLVLFSVSFCCFFLFSFCDWSVLFVIVVSLQHKCTGTADRICNCFLPGFDKDPHLLCCACLEKEYNADDRSGECYEWDSNK